MLPGGKVLHVICKEHFHIEAQGFDTHNLNNETVGVWWVSWRTRSSAWKVKFDMSVQYRMELLVVQVVVTSYRKAHM